MEAQTPQIDGAFPRLNASLLRQGGFTDRLASFVGKFEDRTTFRCCDGGVITLTDEQYEADSLPKDMVVEIMGQTVEPDGLTPFIVRELSQDTDLALYNNMIEIQHNPKFAKFFKQL